MITTYGGRGSLWLQVMWEGHQNGLRKRIHATTSHPYAEPQIRTGDLTRISNKKHRIDYVTSDIKHIGCMDDVRRWHQFNSRSILQCQICICHIILTYYRR